MANENYESAPYGFMRASEVCAFFAISRSTLHQWTQKGLLDSAKIRGSRRWTRRSVHDLAARHLDIAATAVL